MFTRSQVAAAEPACVVDALLGTACDVQSRTVAAAITDTNCL
jgi:hypothetical protein